MADRDECVYKAKLAEQAERYDEMVEQMSKVAKSSDSDSKLSVEERNLLSVAYKNVIGARRASWRIVSSIEQKEREKASDSKKAVLMEQYRQTIEKELTDICKEVLTLLDEYLIPTADTNSDSVVFYKKMKGDYFRYQAEFAPPGQLKSEKSAASLHAYEDAYTTAQDSLKPTNPIRLGLALNYSVFHYEIREDPKIACELAKKAFDEAIEQIDNLDEDNSYKDSTLIMQLLRDNLTLWTSDEVSQGVVVQDIEDQEG